MNSEIKAANHPPTSRKRFTYTLIPAEFYECILEKSNPREKFEKVHEALRQDIDLSQKWESIYPDFSKYFLDNYKPTTHFVILLVGSDSRSLSLLASRGDRIAA